MLQAALIDASTLSPVGRAPVKGTAASASTSSSTSSHHPSPAGEVSSALTRGSEGREYDEFDDELREGDSWRSASSEAAASNSEEALNSRAFRMRASNLRYAIAAAQTRGSSATNPGSSGAATAFKSSTSSSSTAALPQKKDASGGPALSLDAERRKAGVQAIQASKRKGATADF